MGKYDLYKLDIENNNAVDRVKQIIGFLELYNGHPGYTFIGEVTTEKDFNTALRKFIQEWNPFRRENNILAFVVEDLEENVQSILYENENHDLKWLNNPFVFREEKKMLDYKKINEEYIKVLNDCGWKYSDENKSIIATGFSIADELEIDIDSDRLIDSLKEVKEELTLDKYVCDNFELVKSKQTTVKALVDEAEWIEKSLTQLVNRLEVTEAELYDEESNQQAFNLANRVCNVLSDGYDDEESIEEDINILFCELLDTDRFSSIRCALKELCDRLEDM